MQAITFNPQQGDVGMILRAFLIFICGAGFGAIAVIIRGEIHWWRAEQKWQALEASKREAQEIQAKLFGNSENPIGDSLLLEMGFFDKKDN